MTLGEYDDQFDSSVEAAEAWLDSELDLLERRLGSLGKENIGGVPLDEDYPESIDEPGFRLNLDISDNTFALYDPRDGEVRGIDISNLSSPNERMELESKVRELESDGYDANIYVAPD